MSSETRLAEPLDERQPGSAPEASALHLTKGHNSTTDSHPVVVSFYDGAAEASVTFVGSAKPAPRGEDSGPPDEIRAELNKARSDRRARGRARRYFVRNRLVFMWVLTLEGNGLHGPDGRRQVMAECARFARRYRARYGPGAYFFSPELHPDGHGWHVNFFVSERRPHAEMADLWGHGFVWVTDWRKPKGRRRPGGARAAARYGCKYADKDWGTEVLERGAHRYEVAEGYDPPRSVVRARNLIEARALLLRLSGGLHPSTLVTSDSVPGAYFEWWLWDDRALGGR